MNNFKCNDCGSEMFVNHFRQYSNPKRFTYRNGNDVVCHHCQSKNLEQLGNVVTPLVNTFSSLSNDDKKKMLRKRSDDHFKKHIAERKQHINEEFKNG